MDNPLQVKKIGEGDLDIQIIYVIDEKFNNID